MNKIREFAFCLFASVAVLLLISPKSGAEGPYHFIKEIPVGGEGGWDLLAVDEAARRLYVSHATKVVVIDLDNDTVVGEITDTPGVHGIAIAPKLGRVFTSNGREAKVSVVAANVAGNLDESRHRPKPGHHPFRAIAARSLRI